MDYNNYNNYNNYDNNQYNAQQPGSAYQYNYTAPQTQMNADTYASADTSKKGNGAAITSMIFGILSVTCFCCCGMGVICGLTAIIFAIVSYKKKGSFKGMAIAGLICGIIGMVTGFACDIFWVFGGGFETFWESFKEGFYEGYYGY